MLYIRDIKGDLVATGDQESGDVLPLRFRSFPFS